MNKGRYLQAGKIVNTHGIHGEVRIEPWADSPAFLANLKVIYIDGEPISILSCRIHKSFLLASLEGVLTLEDAIKLKNKVIYISRDDVELEEGRHFVSDLIGLRAIDFDTNEELGIIEDIMSRPANDIYVIKNPLDTTPAKEILIPSVPEFVREINIESGYIKFSLIEGMKP